MRGGAAACRLTIRLPEDPDGDGRCGYESRKLARELKRRHGWRLHITQTPAARLQGRGPDLDRGVELRLDVNRRLKDHEYAVQALETMIDMAAISIMLNQLALA